MREYEVRCLACDVSFPPDTRSCFYCGGRLAPGSSRRRRFSRKRRVASGPAPMEAVIPEGIEMPELTFDEPVDQTRPTPERELHPDVFGRAARGEEEEEPTTRGALPRILSSVAWVLLFVALSVYRACTEP